MSDFHTTSLADEGDISDVFSYVGPAVNNLDHPHARRAPHIVTWTVDDEAQAREALQHEAVVGLVSNVPGEMAGVVAKLCA